MITIETDRRDCSHKGVCAKKNDYNSYIFDMKQTERYIPKRVKVKVNCLDFNGTINSVKSSNLCYAPGWGDDRPEVEYSSEV